MQASFITMKKFLIFIAFLVLIITSEYILVNELFTGNKKLIFDELIKESFQVRKVLSKKFTYLDIAYKVFFAGLVFVILTFIAIMVIEAAHQ